MDLKIPIPRNFSFRRTVASHGWYQLPPFALDTAKWELARVIDVGQKPPVTIFLTSHNLGEVETLCGRVAIISRGRIRAIDTPRNLRDLSSGSETVHITIASGEKISFTRQLNDELLDEKIRELQNTGARIVDIETERATLLDVLERYEATD